MYCNNCGNEVQENWRVCPYCGSKNEKLFTPVAQENVATPQQVYNQPVLQNPYSQPAYQQSYDQQSYNQQSYNQQSYDQQSYDQQSYGQPVDFNKDFINPALPKAKKKSKLPIIITAVVLVVAIILGVVFIPGLIEGDDKEKDNEDYEKDTVTVWIMTSCFDENGNSIKLEYDSENNIKKILFNNDDSGYEYAYDSEGNLKEKTKCSYLYNEMSERYVYDTKGRVTDYYGYRYGEEASHTAYEYDTTDKLVRTTVYNRSYWSDTPAYEYYYDTVYEYDSNGNCIKETATYQDGSIGTTEYTYDGNGRLTAIKDYGNSGLLTEEKYRYNDKGDIIEKIDNNYLLNSDSTTIYTYDYEYDENGNIIKLIRYKNGDFICELEMKYSAVEASGGKAANYNGQQEEITDRIINTPYSMYNQVVC